MAAGEKKILTYFKGERWREGVDSIVRERKKGDVGKNAT